MMRALLSRCVVIAALLSLAAAPQFGADVRKLSLKEAVELAISQNHSLRIARLKIVENEQKKAGEHASYFPQIKDAANDDFEWAISGPAANALNIKLPHIL